MADLLLCGVLESINWQFGTVADWLGAVGTAGALGLTYLLLRKELAGFRQAQSDREQEQAECLAAWVETRRGQPHPVMGAPLFAVLLVHNSGTSAAYEAEGEVWVAGEHTATISIGTVGPGHTVQRTLKHGQVGGDDKLMGLAPGVVETAQPEVVLRFTDSGQRRWERRGRSGLLSRLGARP